MAGQSNPTHDKTKLDVKGGSSNGISWELTDDEWVIKYNGAERLRIASNGATTLTGSASDLSNKGNTTTPLSHYVTWARTAQVATNAGSATNAEYTHYVGSSPEVACRMSDGGGAFI